MPPSFRAPDLPAEADLNRCVHCGLCLPVCPTYRETGNEASSPRGRLYLMRAVHEGRLSMASEAFTGQMAECLGCRACEAACPSGVPYGSLLERSRAQIEMAVERAELPPRGLGAAAGRAAGFWVFRSLGLLRLLCWLVWFYQKSGLQAALRRSGLLRVLRLDAKEGMLPPLTPPFNRPAGRLPAQGTQRHTAALFSGCVMSTAFARVQDATLRVLARSGCAVVIPPGQGCCGALNVHSGDLEGGRALLRRNILAFAAVEADVILVDAAGCGALLKEAGHLMAGDPQHAEAARRFAARVRDIHEYLAEIGLPAGMGELPLVVTYQDPCHMAHAQGVSAAPRQLLRQIPGLSLREMKEPALCCGSAGTYNLTQPEMAHRLGARKVENVVSSGAAVVATGNPGCAMQLRAELRRRGAPVLVDVRFVTELLDEAYRRGER